MTETTPLDAAHAAMEAAPSDDTARLAFFERLADAELFLLLTEEAQGETLSPEVFDVADGRFVLVFDRAERLSRFTGRPAPYGALSGRVLARMLAGQGIGMGVNLEVAPSSILIPADALAWLDDTLGQTPQQVEAHLSEVHPPRGLPERLVTALDTKLATAGGLAAMAYLVGVTYDHGGRGHMLAFVDTRPGAETALAKAAGEALTFSGIEAGAMDVGFFAATDPVVARLAAQGLRFDLPQPQMPAAVQRLAPGPIPTSRPD